MGIAFLLVEGRRLIAFTFLLLQLDTICVRLEEDSLDERESLSELKKTLEELLSITEGEKAGFYLE